MVTVGVPAERKEGERRVALDPSGVALLRASKIAVAVQAGAGSGAGFSDAAFKEAGADIAPDPGDVWAADLVVKVKEPQPDEWERFRHGLTLFCFLHLAADPDLAHALAASGVEAHAFETVTEGSGLPLLAPMSEIAGRAAGIVAAAQLRDGAGVLVGGAAGVPPARAVVIGLGTAGTMAARTLRGLDAEVTGVDVDLGRLRAAAGDGVVTATVASQPHAVGETVADADIVVGAALVPGARAPVVLSQEMVASMRPGSVIVDLAIDQGGCVATARPTTLSDPVHLAFGVRHYCVTNVPGQFPATASRALSAAVAPRVVALATHGEHRSLRGSLNIRGGAVRHPAVASALGTHPQGAHR